MNISTTEIENQAEHHRAHISDLIDELRTRATPGEMVDQFLGWEDGHEVARNFGRQVKNNPMPLALIGAGVAWLMLSDGMARRNDGSSAPSSDDEAEGYVKSRASTAANSDSQVTDSASSAMGYGRERVSDFGDSAQGVNARAKDSVSAASDSVTDTATSAWQKTTQLTQNAADRVKNAGSSLGGMAQEQPLMAAGLGFALGMALGAILPGTETENSLLGEQSDAVRKSAGELAGEGYDKTVAQKSYEPASQTAKEEVQNQGLTSDRNNPSQEVSEAQHVSPPDGGEPSYTGTNGGDYPSGGAYPHH